MPRDKRLYMTFPIDMHRHPKLQRLAKEDPAICWTFIEMNGEARIAGNDGMFKASEAEFMWPKAHLDALVASHPDRPLVERTDYGYRIREYAEHQLTVADQQQLTAKRSAAGKASAAARSTRVEHVLSTSQHPATESESESEIKTSVSRVKLASVRACMRAEAGLTISDSEALALSTDILARAAVQPDDPTAYIRKVIVNDTAKLKASVLKARPVHEVRQAPTCEKHPGYPFPCKRCAEGT